MKRVMSGMRPTGQLHVGNLAGALENWVKLQDDHLCFYCIVDWHALTTSYDESSQIQDFILDMAMDWLAAGIDPEKSVVFVQSQVKEHAELHLLLSMITPVSWLERVPTYKDQVKQLALAGKDVATYGFLGYPVLQAADILIYKAELVPVGEDQLPHLELCREIARRFNHLYKPILPEPQALLNKVPTLPGIDSRKMSKTYGNEIKITAEPDEIRAKVSAMITDPARIHKHDPGHPEVCTVYKFHQVYSLSEVEDISAHCVSGKIGCVDCKAKLARQLIERLSPIYDKRKQLEKNPKQVLEILDAGTAKARKYASETIAEVREAIGLR